MNLTWKQAAEWLDDSILSQKGYDLIAMDNMKMLREFNQRDEDGNYTAWVWSIIPGTYGSVERMVTTFVRHVTKEDIGFTSIANAIHAYEELARYVGEEMTRRSALLGTYSVSTHVGNGSISIFYTEVCTL